MSKLTADLLNKFAKCCQANEKYQPQNNPAKVFLLQLAQRNFSQVGTDKGDQQQSRRDECRNRLPRLQQIRPRQKLQA